MGNGTSMEASKAIYVTVKGNTQKIIFSRHCSSRDIVELLAQTAGVHKFSEVTLKDDEGGFVTISPTMPTNKPESAYILKVTDAKTEKDETEMLRSALTYIADNFNKAFQLEELHKDLVGRMEALEKKVELDDLKAIEVEKCKADIKNIRDQIFSTHKKMSECNTLRHTFYGPTVNDSSSKGRRICMKREVPTYPKYTLSQETIDYLKQPTFDIWYWEPNEMLSLLEHMYHELGLVKEFNMNKITLKRWLLCVQENYRNNPFHNFRHCFCVTQMMYGVIHKSGLLEKLSREDIAILITSCVCHDLDHPGYNNSYQINAKTELAIRYNDISPLENHHCAVAFQILSNPETNIFSNVDQVNFKRIRSGMITLILATDMARHGEILTNFKEKIDEFDFTKDEHLISLKMVLIKCCDISNEVRPFEVSEPWVDCLLEEYFNQSDKEKMQGLPVAPFMDRDKVTKPSAQIGFIKFVLIPMFEALSKLFPELSDVLVRPLTIARDRYERMKEAEKDKQINKGN